MSGLTPYTVYRVSVACIPAMRGADGLLQPRGFWSDDASADARTLPDGMHLAVRRFDHLATYIFWSKIRMVVYC